MVIPFNYYLENLKKDILNANNENNKELIDPVLLTEFQKAIKKITPSYWKEIKDLFVQNIDYTYSYDEQMIFTILASQLGLEFLSKKPEYCGELASALCITQKSPLNYSSYAKILLSNQFYRLITEIVQNNNIISYNEMFLIILTKIDNPNLSEQEINFFLKHLYRLNEETYNILIKEDDTLIDIYHKLNNKMHEANKKGLIYDINSFKKLKILLNIINDNNEEEINEIRKELLEIEKENYSIQIIIRQILELLENHKKIILLTRRKTHEPQ